MANCSRDVVIKDDHCLDVLKSFVDFGNIQLFTRLELQNNASTIGQTKLKYAVQITLIFWFSESFKNVKGCYKKVKVRVEFIT